MPKRNLPGVGGFEDSKSYLDEKAIIAQLQSRLKDGLSQYPNDPELSFLLAEVRWRFGGAAMGERNDRAILALYNRAIALDSAFAPAYFAPVSLSAYLDGPESARRYVRAYLALEPSGPRSQILRLDDVLLDPAHTPSVEFGHLLDTLSGEGLCEAAKLMRHIADSSEIVVHLARATAARRSLSGVEAGMPTCALTQLVNGLQFRGHLRDAYGLASHNAHWLRSPVLLHLAELGVVPADTARAAFQHVLSLAPKTTMVRLYRWWAEDGDTMPIRAYLTVFASRMDPRTHDPDGLAMLRSSLSAGNAYLALAKRDTAEALRQFMTTSDTLHECWSQNRTTIVRLLIAQGRYRDAAVRLERRWPGTSECSDGIDDIEWTLERARVSERLGRPAAAAADYAFVAEAWRTADPELQVYVREARNAMARLGVGKRLATLRASGSAIDR